MAILDGDRQSGRLEWGLGELWAEPGAVCLMKVISCDLALASEVTRSPSGIPALRKETMSLKDRAVLSPTFFPWALLESSARVQLRTQLQWVLLSHRHPLRHCLESLANRHPRARTSHPGHEFTLWVMVSTHAVHTPSLASCLGIREPACGLALDT